MLDFETNNNETQNFPVTYQNESLQAEKAAVGEEKQETTSKGVYVHKLARPFTYENKTITELEFHFEDLTGRDMLKIEKEMQDMQEYALAPEISSNFQCKLAAKAANVGSDMLESLPLKDFNRITNAARNFLISTGY